MRYDGRQSGAYGEAYDQNVMLPVISGSNRDGR